LHIWWRNQLGGEALSLACREFYQRFPFRELGTEVATCVVQGWSRACRRLIQEQSFKFTTS
jgi:hypothetical protein